MNTSATKTVSKFKTKICISAFDLLLRKGMAALFESKLGHKHTYIKKYCKTFTNRKLKEF